MLPGMFFRAAFFGLGLFGAACTQPETVRDGGVQMLETEQLIVDTSNGPVRLTVEIADDEAERNRGLMFRQSLADDRGMLFHFQEPERASFWMRNTPLSLDIIFIGVDGRVLNVAERTTPYSDAPVPSAGMTRGVLEIRGGRAAELGIRAGDRVRHRIFPD
ncbi:MAG: DUF192 domain-containing protein [Phycisphaerales bacterium]|nr:DUF192 domain-containing protein [Hyphomonadaceae bacterium]